MNSRQRVAPFWLQIAYTLAFLVIVLQVLLVKPAEITLLADRYAAVIAKAAPTFGAETSEPAAPQEQSAKVATDWFELYLKLVQSTEGFTPPVAARAFGYAGVALYEAVVPSAPSYQSLAGQLNELTVVPQPSRNRTYDWPTVANAALASMARKLFANTSVENLAAIEALEQQWVRRAMNTLDAATVVRSKVYGGEIASVIFAWSKGDGGHEGYLHNFPADYHAPSVRGQWQPTPPKFQPTPLQPTWGNNRPFVLAAGHTCPAEQPFVYSEAPDSQFHQEGLEVYTISQSMSQEQRQIALFWSDDPGKTATPPGHSLSIATQLLKQEKASLMVAAETYAKVGIAVADAFIGCWHAKYLYNVPRPVTYIQQLIDPAWTPLLNTPAFPEYPSGHSVQAGAVATVLAELFGDDTSLVDRTHEARGLAPRSFASLSAMAEEAALSRIYGGIHYRKAITAGLLQGQCIGEKVNSLETRVSSE